MLPALTSSTHSPVRLVLLTHLADEGSEAWKGLSPHPRWHGTWPGGTPRTQGPLLAPQPFNWKQPRRKI